jgi:hypothetical protein
MMNCINIRTGTCMRAHEPDNKLLNSINWSSEAMAFSPSQ